MLQETFCGLYVPSFCICILNSVGPFASGVNPSDWLTVRTDLNHPVEELCRGCFPRHSYSQQGLIPARILLWVYHLCGYLGQALVWSEAHLWLCRFWVHLGEVLVAQVDVRHCV